MYFLVGKRLLKVGNKQENQPIAEISLDMTSDIDWVTVPTGSVIKTENSLDKSLKLCRRIINNTCGIHERT